MWIRRPILFIVGWNTRALINIWMCVEHRESWGTRAVGQMSSGPRRQLSWQCLLVSVRTEAESGVRMADTACDRPPRAAPHMHTHVHACTPPLVFSFPLQLNTEVGSANSSCQPLGWGITGSYVHVSVYLCWRLCLWLCRVPALPYHWAFSFRMYHMHKYTLARCGPYLPRAQRLGGLGS